MGGEAMIGVREWDSEWDSREGCRVTLEMVGGVVLEVECGVMILVAGEGGRFISLGLVALVPRRATLGLLPLGFMVQVVFAVIIHGGG